MDMATHTDHWLLRRLMKLTCFERRLVNSSRHARQTERVALDLLEQVNLPARADCLEVGCGQGALARLLVERFDAQVVASDYDPVQVALAEKRLADLGERVEVRVVDVRSIPFDAGTFDAVFSFGVLHHIPGGWREAVAEVSRVLRPGGWFVFTDFVPSPWAGRLMRRLLPRLDQVEEGALHDCMAQNGIDVVRYTLGQGELPSLIGVMDYCTAVARRKHSAAGVSRLNELKVGIL